MGAIAIVCTLVSPPVSSETVASSSQRYDDQLEKKHLLIGCIKEDVAGVESRMKAHLEKASQLNKCVLSAEDLRKLMPNMPRLNLQMVPMAGTLSPESTFKTNIKPANKAPAKK